MKNSKGNKINIIFSSFLVIGYIVCVYFFSSLASQVSGTLGSLIQVLMIVLFGLLLFYATRVGEGKQIKRFSLAVLLLIDLPALYIILASMVPALPFHDAIAPQSAAILLGGATTPSIILVLACVALGYGLPYTFFSGYEIKEDDEESDDADATVEGGIAEELAEDEAEQTAQATDATVEEITDAVEATAEEADDAAEATAQEAIDTINETEE